MSKLLFGCGYLGQRVLRRWLAAGETVTAVTRRGERAAQWRGEGISALVADVTQPHTLAGLPCADTVLYAVGWDPHSGTSRWQVYVDGLRAVLAALPPQTGRVLLVSSTGVYGDAGGGWVDEDSPCRPRRESGQALLAAEALLHDHPLGRRGIVLRMAGMYGPGRLIRRDELLAGQPMPVADGSLMNLIHVDDAAAAVLAAETSATPPRTYLVSDGHPVERRAYFAYAAELLGAPPPRFVDPPAEGRAARHDDSSKRVGNERLQRELHLTLQYPSYREGLRALLL